MFWSPNVHLNLFEILFPLLGATSDNSHNMGVVGSHLVLHSEYNASSCMFESVEAINHCTD